MLRLTIRGLHFVYACFFISVIDRADRLQRKGGVQHEYMRLLRRVLALEAQLDCVNRAPSPKTREPVPIATRAAQVFAAILTREDRPFQQHYLTAGLGTIWRWASRFRNFGHEPRKSPGKGGRDALDPKIVELIVTLKTENPGWGTKRIKQELRRMGVKVSEPTISKVLIEKGFPPFPERKMTFKILQSTARDNVWAMDFFAVRTMTGKLVQVLLIIDVFTRELIDLRVHDGWDVDSIWTCRTLNHVIATIGRQPEKLLHDHGPHFSGGHFERNLRVLEIENSLSVVHMPWTNPWAERAIYSIRREMLDQLVMTDAKELQWYLDEFRAFSNLLRPHQGILGKTPQDVAELRPVPPPLSIDQLRERKLVRKTFANGFLSGYELERIAA